MKSSIVLDTCVVIDFLRGREPAIAFIKSLDTAPAVSAITLTEIFAGLRTRKEEDGASQFFSDARVIPIGAEIAERAGVWSRLYGASHGVDVPDVIIAATVEHHELRLATQNIKHFPMFPKLKRAY